MKRVQSPSSINVYNQCPRKYYYQYILKLETSTNIHLVRGNIAHTVLEDFYSQDIANVNMKNYETMLKVKIQELLIKTWKDYEEKLTQLKLSQDVLTFYFEETLLMLTNWADKFIAKVKSFDNLSFKEIFEKLTPIREQHYISKELSVRGFIDAIEDRDGKVQIMDYKTSKRFELSPSYKRQLGIYALLYKQKHGVSPAKVGIYFLKDRGKYEYTLDVDEELLEQAKKEINHVHEKTKSDNIEDYLKNITPLCKWSTGQCDFYDICFKQKSIKDY